MGFNPRHTGKFRQIDVSEIERLAGLGLNEQQICDSIGIHIATLTRRKAASYEFVEALRRGKAKACVQVSNALFEKAMKGDVTAIIWWEKTRRGFSERVELTGLPEKPIIASEDSHPLAGFTGRPITDSSRLLESNGVGSWETVGEDSSWSGDGGDDGA